MPADAFSATDAFDSVRSSGASLLFDVVSVNTSSTLPPWPSLAVTLTDTDPTSPFDGVPVNVRVDPSNDSQPGRGEPSASVAL